MNLLHFSDASKQLSVVDPKFMRTSAVGKYWEPTPKSFFFVEGRSALKNPGTNFAGRDRYRAKVARRDIYDASGNDPLGFFASWSTVANEQAVRKAGFKGVLFTANNGAETVVILWEKVKVSKINN